MRVLVASPVRQQEEILELYLRSLDRLRTDNMTVEFAFVDDNVVPAASDLLGRFIASHPGSVLLEPSVQVASGYKADEVTHHWTPEAINRVAVMKDEILDYARHGKYDALLLVDSDLLLHPLTLRHLLGTGKDIISEVFWTRWQPEADELPQVWVSGQYDLYERDSHERLSPGVVRERVQAFLHKLRVPGIYEVGGLGACTLLTQRALTLPLSFKDILNVSYVGEDRHFCIRAAALGLQLWVDTHFPALHIYRPSDLGGAEGFFRATDDDTLEEVAKATVGLFARVGTGVPPKEGNDLIEPSLQQHLCRLEALQGASQHAVTSEFRIERVWVYSVDGVRAIARARLWVVNEGLDVGGNFRETAVANVGLRWNSGRWRGSDVQWVPLESDGAVMHSQLGRPRRQPSVHATGRVRLALAMIVRNEANRYLERVLREARHYVDAAAIIDDASNDSSLALCREILSGIPTVTSRNEESMFREEYKLRENLWALTASLDPEWILVLDADEYFEARARDHLRGLLDRTDIYFYAFRLYDFWDESHYRDDGWWRSHTVYRPLLVRYLPGFPYRWKRTPQHCGRLPINVGNLRGVRSNLRVKHMGWARKEDRKRKYERYLRLDPDFEYGIKEQYMTILDPNPRLVRWCEAEERECQESTQRCEGEVGIHRRYPVAERARV